MGTGDAPALADRADPLSCGDGIALLHVGTAEVEVGGDQSSAVVDVNRSARKIEVCYQCDDTSPRRTYRHADGSGEVGSQMAALYLAVEDPCTPEAAGDPGRPGQPESPAPETGSFLRPDRDLSAPGDL